jgi:hypothetical protein
MHVDVRSKFMLEVIETSMKGVPKWAGLDASKTNAALGSTESIGDGDVGWDYQRQASVVDDLQHRAERSVESSVSSTKLRDGVLGCLEGDGRFRESNSASVTGD